MKLPTLTAVVLVAIVFPAVSDGQTLSAPAAKIAATQPAAGPAFAKYVPAWTTAYLEIKGLDDLIEALVEKEPSVKGAEHKQEPAVPVPGGLLGRYNKVIKAALGLSGREFLADLLGSRFALAWGGPNQPRQVGLICRPAKSGAIYRLLSAAKAERIQDADTNTGSRTTIELYELPLLSLRAAVFEDKLMLGTVGKTGDTGMFYDMVDLAKGGKTRSLTEFADFRRIAEQIDSDLDVFFAFFSGPGTDLKSSQLKDPFIRELFKNFSYLVFTGRLADGRCDLSVIVEPSFIVTPFWPRQPLQLDPPILTLVNSSKVAISYVSIINPGQWYQSILILAHQGNRVAQKNLVILDSLLPDTEIRQQVFESIGPELAAFIRKPPAPDIANKPAPVAILVRLKDPPVVQEAINQITSWISDHGPLPLLAGEADELFTPDEVAHGGFTVHRIPIGMLPIRWSSSSILPFGQTDEVAWVIAGEYLIIATSYDWLTEILDLQFGPAATTRPAEPIVSKSQLVHLLVTLDLQEASGYLARMFQNDIGSDPPAKKVADTQPKAKSKFSARPIVLGIRTQLIADPQTGKPQIRVAAVLPGYPADGKLYPDDIIITVDDVPLTERDPQSHLRRLIVQMAASDAIRLTVRRKEALVQVEIELKAPDGSKRKGETLSLSIRRKAPSRSVLFQLKPRADLVQMMGQTIRLLHQVSELASKKFERLTVIATYSPTGQIKVDATLK